MPTPATFGQPGQWPGRLRGRLLIIRWESRTWTRSASPRLRAGGCLYAMAAATASDAWAVGCAGRNGFSGTGADRVPGRRLVEEGAGRARCRVKRPVRRRRLLRPGCVRGRPRGLEQDARRALGRVGVAAGVQHVVVVRARLRGLRHGAQPALRWWFRVAGCPCQRYLYAGVPGPHFLGGQQDGYVLGRAGALDTVLLCLSFPDSAGVAGGCAAAGRTCASSTVSAGSSEPRGVELGARGGRLVARP